MIAGVLESLSRIEDPRLKSFVTYPLPEILLGAVVGTVCGAEDWEEIELVCEERLDFLRGYLPYDHGIPSHDTFERVFDALDGQLFADCFAAWVGSIIGAVKGVVAIDGKTIRGATQAGGAEKALHILSAFAHESGMVIGQRCVDGKSNEITAIPLLLNTLDIAGTLVTLDAMGAQKTIARAILDKKADYLLALKGNQSSLHEDVKLFFADAELSKTCAVTTTTDHGHGRVEERVCRVTDDIAWLKEQHPEWVGLRSIVAITSTRTDKKTKVTTTETRFYITSLAADAARILAATRAHWGIENSLHWMLDVIMGEDACQTRKKNAALNLASARKWALGLLKKHPAKMPIKRKIKKAALNASFLKEIFC
jgi:predicted transposase YbfD/YdcC